MKTLLRTTASALVLAVAAGLGSPVPSLAGEPGIVADPVMCSRRMPP